MKKIKIFLKKNKWIVIAVLAVVVIIFIGQYFLSRSGSSTSSNQQTSVADAKVGNILSGISTSGAVQTSNYIAVTTSVNGIVNKVLVKEGDTVYKGQTLMTVTLDSEGITNQSNAYANYLRAKESLDGANEALNTTYKSAIIQAQLAFNTAQDKMNDSKSKMMSFEIADYNLQKAKQDYELQKSNISQLQIALSNALSQYQAQALAILAPANGVVANIVAVEGTNISNTVSTTGRSTQTVASIKQPGTPIATLNVTELDIDNVKSGQKVNITLNSLPDQPFTGTVVGIDKIGTISGGVANYPVNVKFDVESDKVLPNMGLNATVVVAEHNHVLYVPTAAITTQNGKSTVRLVQGNTYQVTEISTGLSDGTNTEIVSGLKEGDQVLVNALPTTGFTTQTNQNRGGGGFRLF